MSKNFDVKKYNGDYFIGLDIGTNSVGWAVVDENMNLLKYQKKNAWGSRLFDEALSASNRRLSRGLRRRYVRRSVRLGMLEEIMAPFVDDEDFLQRMKESFYHVEDRTQKNRFNLFDDVGFDDRDFYKKYPTIYHLRYDLMNKDEKFDRRLVYLAIHHILKYRGNFLYENLSIAENENLSKKFAELLNNFSENWDVNFEFKDTIESTVAVLLDNDKTNREKIKDLKYGNNEDLLKLLLGQKANLDNIFDGNEFGDQSDLSFNSENVDETISGVVGFEEILSQCYDFYNLIQFKKIMKDAQTISEAMIKRYDKFGKDLQLLRGILKKYLSKEEYNSYFRDLNKNDNNFALYTTHGGNCSYEQFKDALKSKLKTIKTEEEQDKNTIKNIIEQLDNDNFLRKLRTGENGVFPMQVHLYELEKIIDNQSKFHPSLIELKQQIITLFKFRIDYYVGPLAKRKDTDFGWIKKKLGYENVTVTPFNYAKAVDFEACQESFITRMTGNCTYILGEKALPKNSIYYMAYNILNELNNIRYYDGVGEKSLSSGTRAKIFAHLMQNNTIKKKNIEHFIWQETGIDNVSVSLSNDERLNSNLKPYKDFVNILGKVDATNIDMVEKCIEWITIFGENKQVLKAKLQKSFGDVLTQEQLDRIARLTYTGWGRLSKRLLVELKVKVGEEYKSILDLMQEAGESNYYKNFNFVYTRYGFKKQVEDLNKNVVQGSPREAIDSLACSPALKRGITQSFRIVDEIIKLFKRPPAKIFIEFAREEGVKGKKGMKASRKTQIIELYDEIEKNRKDLLQQMDSNALDILYADDNKELFDDEKFLLYFLQMGKCAYSGLPLDINRLSQDCHVDHIVPRTLIKDDSIDNKVLVLARENERKLDDETVLSSVQKKMKGAWALWKERKLMTAEKFARLTKTCLTENDKKRFINRQLVETRQITVNVAEILQSYFAQKGYNTEIKPVRAGLNSLFREKFGYYKGLGGRAINDFHHAKDAYITVFMGRYVELEFSNLSSVFVKFNTQKTDGKQPRHYGFVVDSLNNGLENWGDTTLTNEQALANFERNYYYSDILFTKMTTTKSNGEFYNATRYKSKKNAEKFNTGNMDLISLGKKYDKSCYLNTDDYGGYTSANPACFAVVRYFTKKVKYMFLGIPIRLVISQDENVIKEYLQKETKSTNCEIVTYIPKQQLMKINQKHFRITGINDRNTAKQLVFGRKNKVLYEFIYYIFNNWKGFAYPNDVDKQSYLNQYFDANYELFKQVYLAHLKKNFPDFTGSVYNKVVAIFDKYDNLDIVERSNAIKELLKITQCNSARSNLAEFSVRLLFSIDKSIENAYLIYQSVTGLKQKTVKITDLM